MEKKIELRIGVKELEIDSETILLNIRSNEEMWKDVSKIEDSVKKNADNIGKTCTKLLSGVKNALECMETRVNIKGVIVVVSVVWFLGKEALRLLKHT